MVDDNPAAQDRDLPWLQEVEDEDAPRGVSARTMLAGVLVVLFAAALVAAGFFWLGQRGGAVSGAPELIRAPEGPYKVRPDDPGGLDVEGSRTTFATSVGEDIDSRLDVPSDAGTVPARIPPNETKEPLPAETRSPPEPAPAGAPGSVIQLGAYANSAQAERAWTALSTRFGAVSGLAKMIVPYSAGARSGYRLRAAAASPEQARQVCQALQAAGESCFIVR